MADNEPLNFDAVKAKEDLGEEARTGADAQEWIDILEEEPIKPQILGERIVPTWMKPAFNRPGGGIGNQATAEETRMNQPLMHALRANANHASLQEVEPTSTLIEQHQQTWLFRAERGFTELGDNPFSDNWLDDPFNWTALELQAIQRGVDVGTLIEFEAADSLYADAKAAYDENVMDLAFGQAQVEVQLQISDAWMGWDELTEGKLPEHFMDALALGFPREMEQPEIDQFISEFGIEVEGNPDMLNDPQKVNDLLGRMLVRIQQIAGQAKRKREIRDRGFLKSLDDLVLGIADPLFGPGINFEDQGILSGLEGVFQPFEDVFIKPAARNLRDFWVHTADPDNPFRPHISLGQNIAVSAGQDANTWGYTMMSGAIDLSTYIVFDPLSYIGSLAKGLKMAGKLALGVEAIANGSRTTRVLKAMVPFGAVAGKKAGLGKAAVGLGWRGGKGWTARVMYQIFAKDVDTLMLGARARKMGETVTDLAHLDRLDEAIRLYPELAKNQEILALAKVSSADEWLEIVGEAMKGNLKSNKTIEVAERAVRTADKNLDDTIRALAESGTLDLADLTHILQGNGKAMRNVDMVIIGSNGIGSSRGKQAADGVRVLAWTSKPVVGNLSDPKIRAFLRRDFHNNALLGRLQAAVRKGEGAAFIDNMSRGQVKALEDAVSDMGLDMLRLEDGKNIVGTRGQQKLMSVVDGPGTESAAAHLGAQMEAKSIADYLHKSAKNMTDELWWVDTLPKRSSVKELLGIKPLSMKVNANAGARTQSWWSSFRRNRRGWLTQGGKPKHFSLHDSKAAVEQIQQHARFAGIDATVEARWVRDFINTVPEQRARFFGQMMEETADLVGDWRMKHQMRYNNAHAGQNLTHGDDGMEVAMGPSRSRPGVDVGKPHEPGMLAENFPGWDASWYDEIARLRTARAKIRAGSRKSVTGRTWTRTSKKRQQLVEKYRRSLARDGIDTRSLELGDDDLWAMAYATIDSAATQGVNGLGTISQLAGVGSRAWGTVHRGFTLTALGLRPIIWPLKVVFGEEQIRGQLSGMLNMYAHPIRYFKTQALRHTLQQARKSMGALTEARGIARVTLGTKMDEVARVSDDIDDMMRAIDPLLPGWRSNLPTEFINDLTPQQVRVAAKQALDEDRKSVV